MAVIILGGVIAHVCPYYTPFLKAQWNKQNYNYAAALSISLGFHRKILIHKRVWRLTWVVSRYREPQLQVGANYSLF